MRILALESSTCQASVALLEGERVVGSAELGLPQRTAGSLAPAIADQLEAAGWRPRQIELVAVSQGPGSFTGLRIGVTTAKLFAYAVGAEILGVNTLEVIAAQAELEVGMLWAVVDAQRGQLFAALFRGRDGIQRQVCQPPRLVDSPDWLHGLSDGEGVTGPGLARLLPQLPPYVKVESPARWDPQAVTVGRFALHRFARGERADCWSLVPQYFRESAAQEKWRGSARIARGEMRE